VRKKSTTTKTLASARESRIRNIQLSHLLHEIRAPLARMRVAVGLINQSPRKSEEDIDRLAMEIERIEQLMHEVVDWDRVVKNSKVDHQFELLQLSGVIVQVVDDLRYEASESDVQIDVVLDPNISIRGNVTWIKRVVENILRNSLRHVSAGGHIQLDLYAKTKKSARILIQDNGCGVPKSELENIFDPFFRSSVSVKGAKSGMGLGLTIVRAMVAHHGGKVWAESARPGLKVIIDLPIKSASRESRARAKKS
jgi:two-component system OmpR family sensor kinase